jgi:hypothetical protein
MLTMLQGHVVNNIGLFAQTGFYNQTNSRSHSLVEGGAYYERSKVRAAWDPVSEAHVNTMTTAPL